MECAIALLYYAIQIHNGGKSLQELKMYSSDLKNGKKVVDEKLQKFLKLIRNNVDIHYGQTFVPKDIIRKTN